jgi:hypothetical protein
LICIVVGDYVIAERRGRRRVPGIHSRARSIPTTPAPCGPRSARPGRTDPPGQTRSGRR